MTSHSTQSPFAPLTLAGFTLRNRIIKAATFEGMTHGGVPSDRLIEFHRRAAAGGSALSTVAYGAVSMDAKTFKNQITLNEESIPLLKPLTGAIHNEGAGASIQLAHCGFFTKNPDLSTRASRGPTGGVNTYGLFSGIPFAKAMTHEDIEKTTADYAHAARIAVEAGFDALEIHMGHGYLLSQFISPGVNKREDEYGGSVENRIRFPLAVVKAVREAVGDDVPLLAKTNLEDGFETGLLIDEAVQVSQALEDSGLNALVLSGGFVAKTPMYLFRGPAPIEEMIDSQSRWIDRTFMRIGAKAAFKDMPFEELYFLDEARQIREAVSMPLFLIGGVTSLAGIQKAMAEGFDGVAMARALIHDPDLVNKYRDGLADHSGCTTCNLCWGGMDRPEGVHCRISDAPPF